MSLLLDDIEPGLVKKSSYKGDRYKITVSLDRKQKENERYDLDLVEKVKNKERKVPNFKTLDPKPYLEFEHKHTNFINYKVIAKQYEDGKIKEEAHYRLDLLLKTKETKMKGKFISYYGIAKTLF